MNAQPIVSIALSGMAILRQVLVIRNGSTGVAVDAQDIEL